MRRRLLRRRKGCNVQARSFQVPGFLWTAAIALLPLLAQWIQGDYFSGQAWVSVAVIVIGALLKLLEVYRPTDAQTREVLDAPARPSKARRFLLG